LSIYSVQKNVLGFNVEGLFDFNGNGKYSSPEFVWKYSIAGSTEGAKLGQENNPSSHRPIEKRDIIMIKWKIEDYLQNSTIILNISNIYGEINHTTDWRSDLI
jgi:hypothetical protein